MQTSGLDWIDDLPPELAGQQALLRGLLALCDADDRIRWLVIGCSLARGAGDRLSDLDMAMGIRDEDFDAARPGLRRAVDGLGELIESYHHQLPSVTQAHERIFAQFADRSQIDLVLFPASVPGGSVPNVVVLYDPDEQLVAAGDSKPVTSGQIREWAFGGWCALADLGKYLRRGSTWEALARLNEARSQLWQLWAVTLGVPDPQYGLTSVLDFAPAELPASFEGTVADLDPGRLLDAGRRVAELLNEVGKRLPDDQRAALPEAMARYITADLEHVRHEILRNLCRSQVAERRECGIRAFRRGYRGLMRSGCNGLG